ncbi:class I SAM-dependent methyltransferase [Paenibacillus sp. FSL R5-0407]|uniref:class I SAM-dependent methyltransferase n=1 Tax=Paenibacillus sp. FSL R5-0407 TaxID=2975320 RepID=UPI0030F65068
MESNEKNKQAWDTGAFEAWIKRFGTPGEAAQKLQTNPQKKIGEIYPYFGEVAGKKMINLLGSNGMKAVALSLLGANVTVVDFSADNEKYAKELAEAAGTQIRYIQSDVFQLPQNELTSEYDVVFMEKGVLHYFLDLQPLFEVVAKLLKPGGRFVLQDFHPVTTKLISSRGTTANIRKHKVTGNYFDDSVVEREVAYSKYSDEDSAKKVYQRYWTLGEVITSIATTGLFIKELRELPNLSSEVFDAGIPKSFIVVAEKL